MDDEEHEGLDSFLRQAGKAACLVAVMIFILLIVLNEMTTVADHVNVIFFIAMIFLGAFGGLLLWATKPNE